MRTPIVAGNWKMNLGRSQAQELASGLRETAGKEKGVEVILCPSYTLLHVVHDAVQGSSVALGAQNLFWEEKGAYTGEVSASMLLDSGCSHVIIGHSERRQYFGETDASVRRRLVSALEAGLIPIVCVGETLEEREEGSTELVIERQISGALERFKPEDAAKIIIAYEPVWAIGTGRTATPVMAQEVHRMIRNWMAKTFGDDVAEGVRILYGGSMKPGSAAELMAQPDIDGGLIGGASLKVDDFTAIIQAAR
ncbi:triose-phosphate isomerase [bacterium]|nr:triose-phosphate isomerase [bacterium]